MTGIVVVTHDGLGEALRREAEHILGQPLDLVTVAISYRARIDQTLDMLRATLSSAADAGGAVILTDLPGATPHNLAMTAAEELGFPLVSGLNLPMLLKVVNHADKPSAALARLAVTGGMQGITGP